MQKVQLVCVDSNQNHAGSKAVTDIIEFLTGIGYKKIVLLSKSSESIFGKILEYFIFLHRIFSVRKQYEVEKTILFLQYPFPMKKNIVKIFLRILNASRKKNKIRVITLLHDIDELRYGNVGKDELDNINSVSNLLIVHNEKMIEYLIQRGVDKKKLVNLEIFDYIVDGDNRKKQIFFEKKIIIAGNLDSNKAAYLKDLKILEKSSFDLYGPNFNKKDICCKNIRYQGSVQPAVLPSKFCSGFGLVWDGESIESCCGFSGNYLRYNNPHKLSLYLAAGIPVIVWKNSALANFITQNNLGIVVESLKDLPQILDNLTEKEYLFFSESVRKFSKRLHSGYFIKKAIKECENRIFLEDIW